MKSKESTSFYPLEQHPIHPMSNQQEEKVPNSIIWLNIDFETVKHRIDKITDKINDVLVKFNVQGASDFSNQGRKSDDIF